VVFGCLVRQSSSGTGKHHLTSSFIFIMTAISEEAMQLLMQQMEAMRKELAEEKQQREAGKKEREDDKAELASLRRMAQQHRRTTMYQPFSSPGPQAAGAEPGVYQHQTPTM
jgi:predicted phage tail protein